MKWAYRGFGFFRDSRRIHLTTLAGDDGYRRRACQRGIPDTANTGYAVLLASYGVLPMSDAIGSLVMSRVSTDEIRKRSNRWGMVTLRRKRALEGPRGSTTIEEVLRVTASGTH
jgi:type II secretory ATPase GspE/PulE/Tfp pilus assembly ATPase PilB-like protein